MGLADLLREAAAEVESLQAQVAEKDQQIAAKDQSIAEKDAQIAGLQARIQELEAGQGGEPRFSEAEVQERVNAALAAFKADMLARYEAQQAEESQKELDFKNILMS